VGSGLYLRRFCPPRAQGPMLTGALASRERRQTSSAASAA
jgi:hypothetical protein